MSSLGYLVEYFEEGPQQKKFYPVIGITNVIVYYISQLRSFSNTN